MHLFLLRFMLKFSKFSLHGGLLALPCQFKGRGIARQISSIAFVAVLCEQGRMITVYDFLYILSMTCASYSKEQRFSEWLKESGQVAQVPTFLWKEQQDANSWCGLANNSGGLCPSEPLSVSLWHTQTHKYHEEGTVDYTKLCNCYI